MSSKEEFRNPLPLLPGNSFTDCHKRNFHKNQLFVRCSMGSMGNIFVKFS